MKTVDPILTAQVVKHATYLHPYFPQATIKFVIPHNGSNVTFNTKQVMN
jgi:hypothetical protein